MFLGTLWGCHKSVATKNILVRTPPISQIENGTKTARGARVWGELLGNTPGIDEASTLDLDLEIYQ